ncbi:MAG: hypothetical protein O9320_06840 [Magnetospirillum sp.]|nr:hypothetical protein [Magnetospirillum sp.]
MFAVGARLDGRRAESRNSVTANFRTRSDGENALVRAATPA